MIQHSSTISGHYLNVLRQSAERNSLHFDALLIQSGIASGSSMDVADCKTKRFEPLHVSKLLKLMWLALDDEFLGFTSDKCKVGVFKFYAELAISETTIGDALRLACKYYSTIRNDIELALVNGDGEARLIFTHFDAQNDPYHFLVEYFLLTWHRFSCWISAANIKLRRVNFQHTAPEHVAEYALLFPADCEFKQNENSLVFDESALKLPLRQTAIGLKSYVARSPIDILMRPRFEFNTSRIVAYHLSSGEIEEADVLKSGDEYSINAISQKLGMSSRNLRRKLTKEGTSFQQIKSELRKQKALVLLADSSLSVSQVAYKLGFTEASAFSRAFKDWSGMTPSSYRETFMA